MRLTGRKKLGILFSGSILLGVTGTGRCYEVNEIEYSSGGYNGFGAPVQPYSLTSAALDSDAILSPTVFSINGSGPNGGGTGAWSQNFTASGEIGDGQIHAKVDVKSEAISSDGGATPSIGGNLTELTTDHLTEVLGPDVVNSSGWDTITASWIIKGGFTSSATAGSGSVDSFGNYASATSTVTFNATGMPVNLNATAQYGVTNAGAATSVNLPDVIPVSFLVQVGKSFEVDNRLQIAVQAQTQVGGPSIDGSTGMIIPDPITDEEVNLGAEFGNSILWGGVTSVTDYYYGTAVTDFSLIGDSGFDYRYAAVDDDVPEPASFGILVLGLVAILGQRVRKTRAC